MTLAFVLLARWYWCDTEPLKGMLSVAAWSEAHAASVKMFFFSQKENQVKVRDCVNSVQRVMVHMKNLEEFCVVLSAPADAYELADVTDLESAYDSLTAMQVLTRDLKEGEDLKSRCTLCYRTVKVNGMGKAILAALEANIPPAMLASLKSASSSSSSS